MHTRHLSLLAAMLLACIAPGAGAQVIHQPPSGYTSVVVKFSSNNVTWNAKAVQWNAVQPSAVSPLIRGRDAPVTQPRDSRKPAAASVEIIDVVPSAEPALSGWQASVGKPAGNMEITLVNPAGTPLAKYYLTGTIVTKAYSTENDAGGAKIVALHVAFTAQSLTIESTGQ